MNQHLNLIHGFKLKSSINVTFLANERLNPNWTKFWGILANSNVTDGVKKQADTSSVKIYKLVDLKGEYNLQ